MADPVIVTIPEWTWVKIASATSTGLVSKITGTPVNRLRYFQTYRAAGGAAPGAITPPPSDLPAEEKETYIPEEAVEIYISGNSARIISDTNIDVYIMCMNEDYNLTENGKVRVDL